jgi:hypothetical protein
VEMVEKAEEQQSLSAKTDDKKEKSIELQKKAEEREEEMTRIILKSIRKLRKYKYQ